MSRLAPYLAKRDFDQTPEPTGGVANGLAPRYSIQNHAATRLHWDLRLEWDGVLLSWAITRGPSFDPSEKRLAVRTEDHPLDYLTFEGTIPKGNYGAGTVMLWDIGYWQPTIDVEKGLKKGHLKFALHGERLTGAWNLIRMQRKEKRENWLLIKEDDEAADDPDPVKRYTTSVSTRRKMKAITEDAEMGKGHERRGALPRWRKPQLATLTDTLGNPETRWHELKFDGYRAEVALGKGGVRIYTRNGHDWTEKFAQLAPAFDALPCDSALIDGEITVGAGLYGFGALQKAIKLGGPFQFHAFDLMHCDGDTLSDKPLTERRARLEKLFDSVPPLGLLQLSPVLEWDPTAAFEAICGNGGEGLISKQKDAPYRGGRSAAWQKIKCVKRAEFVILGWQASGSKGRPFASLALGVEENGSFRYVGKVGTGWDEATQDEIAARMAPLSRKTPPADVPKEDVRGMRWLTPRLVAEVRFAEFTEDGRLRHAVFLGLREDKAAEDVKMEVPVVSLKKSENQQTEVAGISISSPEREVYPGSGITKLDVAHYYEAVAERMLLHAADRPLSLVRLPEGLDGERFFQKHAGKGFPSAIHAVPVKESDGKEKDYMYVKDAAGLVGAVQMGTLEFHIWGARRDRLDRPDRLVFDLDPDEDLDFAAVRDAAFDIRGRLDHLGLPSWPLLTGGKGIHVTVPLRRTATWETVTLFARTFAGLSAQRSPETYTATMPKAKRKGRIFIDWLRNDRGSTAICPWSLRAKPGAPAAVPTTWDALQKAKRANGTDLRQAIKLKDPGHYPEPATFSNKVIERLETAFADEG